MTDFFIGKIILLICIFEDKHVSLTITHMDISKDCSSPVLKIYDGESDEAPLIGGYCGNKSPSLIVSVGNAMHITLNYAYGATFQAVYSVIKTGS